MTAASIRADTPGDNGKDGKRKNGVVKKPGLAIMILVLACGLQPDAICFGGYDAVYSECCPFYATGHSDVSSLPRSMRLVQRYVK